MSEGKTAQPSPPLSKAFGFSMSMLTLGIGVMRSVGPSEILMRTVAAGVVSWIIARSFGLIWVQMSEGILEDDQ
ncbi:MAG: hypothetical protein P8J37_08295 [Fuerstiella sp.]|nr:hypothetical protein [Fuerstiella sp.]